MFSAAKAGGSSTYKELKHMWHICIQQVLSGSKMQNKHKKRMVQKYISIGI